jgi:alpha-D-ribose 1-methylphosphonate 5-triphosphate synthase subunit PhnH
MNVHADSLLPGFQDPVVDSQRVFRAVLDAMSRPGTVVEAPPNPTSPDPLHPASAAVLLAMADFETPVWLDPAADFPEVRNYIKFHCGCPLAADAGGAVFAMIADPATMPPLAVFAQGSDDFPDTSATLILQVPSLIGGKGMHLSGPGIRDRAVMAPLGLPSDFSAWLAENHARFPRGVDVVFASGRHVAALPRSTRLVS